MPLATALLLAVVLLLPARVASAAGWVWPLAGAPPVARGFAPGAQPWAPGHRGVDLVAPAGSPVLAAGAGRVTFAAVLAGRGVVVVTHGALRTTYEPVTADVRVGGAVAAGDRIGVLLPGHPGCPAAACLHWGMLRGETYLDPLRLVRPGPVRLLPRAPTDPTGVAPGPAGVASGPAGVASGPAALTRPEVAVTLPDRRAARPGGPGPAAPAGLALAVAACVGVAGRRRPPGRDAARG